MDSLNSWTEGHELSKKNIFKDTILDLNGDGVLEQIKIDSENDGYKINDTIQFFPTNIYNKYNNKLYDRDLFLVGLINIDSDYYFIRVFDSSSLEILGPHYSVLTITKLGNDLKLQKIVEFRHYDSLYIEEMSKKETLELLYSINNLKNRIYFHELIDSSRNEMDSLPESYIWSINQKTGDYIWNDLIISQFEIQSLRPPVYAEIIQVYGNDNKFDSINNILDNHINGDYTFSEVYLENNELSIVEKYSFYNSIIFRYYKIDLSNGELVDKIDFDYKFNYYPEFDKNKFIYESF